MAFCTWFHLSDCIYYFVLVSGGPCNAVRPFIWVFDQTLCHCEQTQCNQSGPGQVSLCLGKNWRGWFDMCFELKCCVCLYWFPASRLKSRQVKRVQWTSALDRNQWYTRPRMDTSWWWDERWYDEECAYCSALKSHKWIHESSCLSLQVSTRTRTR